MDKYYKFLCPDGSGIYSHKFKWSLPNEDELGDVHPAVRGDLKMCVNGYHVCTADQLLLWGQPNTILVQIYTETDEKIEEDEKICLRGPVRVAKRIDTWSNQTNAQLCAAYARRVLNLFERLNPGNTRPRESIEMAEAYARGDIQENKWDAARAAATEAAWTVARDVAGDTAWAAAWDAAWAAAWGVAGDTAWDAAKAAARAAAGEAARDAALDAARAAAWDAARVAAWDAERKWQREEFKRVVGIK